MVSKDDMLHLQAVTEPLYGPFDTAMSQMNQYEQDMLHTVHVKSYDSIQHAQTREAELQAIILYGVDTAQQLFSSATALRTQRHQDATLDTLKDEVRSATSQTAKRYEERISRYTTTTPEFLLERNELLDKAISDIRLSVRSISEVPDRRTRCDSSAPITPALSLIQKFTINGGFQVIKDSLNTIEATLQHYIDRHDPLKKHTLQGHGSAVLKELEQQAKEGLSPLIHEDSVALWNVARALIMQSRQATHELETLTKTKLSSPQTNELGR